MRLISFFSVLLAVAFTSGSVRAEGFQTNIVGGPGGGAWELNCPDYRSLVGVYIRFTNFVEQLDAICVSSTDGTWRDTPRRVFASNGHNTPSDDGSILLLGTDASFGTNAAIGGDGGDSEDSIVCARNSLVYALTVDTAVSTGRGDHEVVGRIHLHCVNPRTAKEDIMTAIPGPQGADEYVTRWPTDCRSQTGRYWATGLVGRAGAFIDAIGLHCASPSAPVRPLNETSTKSPPILSPPVAKALGRVKLPPGTPAAAPVSICDAAKSARARNSPAAPGLERQCNAILAASQTNVPIVALPAASLQRFDVPLTVGGERLHACMHLPHSDCEQSPAEAFCKGKGFNAVDDFDTERGRLRSETWTGELCTSQKCRVFTQITCTN